MRELICEKCRTKFICNGSGYDCWCFDQPYIRLDKTEQYTDCLCERCVIELYHENSENNYQR